MKLRKKVRRKLPVYVNSQIDKILSPSILIVPQEIQTAFFPFIWTFYFSSLIFIIHQTF